MGTTGHRLADGGSAMAEDILPRTFRDEDGLEWEVRAITPATKDRRAPVVRPDLANGWLLFTLGLERRRLAPLPSAWREASESQLEHWRRSAQPVASRGTDLDHMRRTRP
jgi:hypothetical protein